MSSYDSAPTQSETPTRTRVAVVGASGYSGEELLHILLRHSGVDLVSITSRQYAGKSLESVYPRFRGRPGLGSTCFVAPSANAVVESGADFAFLALPHGLAHEFALPLLQAGVRVIDLSADFRIKDAAVYEEFYKEIHPAPALLDEAVYGLPEWRREEIAQARLVAAPGCYPTSILLPLLPLLKDGLVDPHEICVSSMSGTTGAGRKADLDLIFAECDSSIRAYGAPKHRHLSEMEQELSLAAGVPLKISFIPHLVPIRRGISTNIHTRPTPNTTDLQIESALRQAYAAEPFVRLLPEGAFPDTKNVTDTNFIDIAWRSDPRTGRLLLFSAEDNLGKGAAGQAVQCFNLMAGWTETEGIIS